MEPPAIQGSSSLTWERETIDYSCKTFRWGADWHLDHKNEAERQDFYNQIKDQPFDFLVLAGDTELATENPARGSQGLIPTLRKIQSTIQRQIIFLCGNHDYYLGSIEGHRKE